MKSDSYSKRIWRIVSPLLLYFVVSLLASIIFLAVFSSQIVNQYDLTTVQGYNDAYKAIMDKIYENGLLMTGVVAVICIPLLLRMFKRDSMRLYPIPAEKNPIRYSILALLGFSGALALNAIITVSGVADLFADSFEDTSVILYSAPIWMQCSISVVMGPIMEELIFRGIIFRRMRTYCIFPLAMLVSSILFGAYHMNILQFIYATLLGMMGALAYEKYGTILAPIIVHVCANGLSVLLSNDNGVAMLVSGTEDRIAVATVVSSIVALICLAFVINIKRESATASVDGTNGEYFNE